VQYASSNVVCPAHMHSTAHLILSTVAHSQLSVQDYQTYHEHVFTPSPTHRDHPGR